MNLSERLISRYEGGWTVDTLKRCRFFYRIYCPQQIGATVLPQSEVLPDFTLSWSHYLVLMRIKNPVTQEFVGLKPDASYSESNLESAIIGNLQEFLLELGKGFLFELRESSAVYDANSGWKAFMELRRR